MVAGALEEPNINIFDDQSPNQLSVGGGSGIGGDCQTLLDCQGNLPQLQCSAVSRPAPPAGTASLNLS